MSRIWVNLRTPARDNPNPVPLHEGISIAVLLFAVGFLILLSALVLALLALRQEFRAARDPLEAHAGDPQPEAFVGRPPCPAARR